MRINPTARGQPPHGLPEYAPARQSYSSPLVEFRHGGQRVEDAVSRADEGAARQVDACSHLPGAAGTSRRRSGGSLHPRLADQQPARALLRHHHAAARGARHGAGRLDRARPAAGDPGRADDRGASRAGVPASHRRPSPANAPPRAHGATAHHGAEASGAGHPPPLADAVRGDPARHRRRSCSC